MQHSFYRRDKSRLEVGVLPGRKQPCVFEAVYTGTNAVRLVPLAYFISQEAADRFLELAAISKDQLGRCFVNDC